jgi:uncharacterized protein YciI
MDFVIFYELVEDYLEKRGRFREQHLELARKSADRGELILRGPLDPVDIGLSFSKTKSQLKFSRREIHKFQTG